MRRASIILLASATLTIFTAAPAFSAERFCAKWVNYILRNPDGTYSRGPLTCMKWVVLAPAQPVNPFWRFEFGMAPTDPSPWISEREYKVRFLPLNPQPLPPVQNRRRQTML